jgi:hypothetical protein
MEAYSSTPERTRASLLPLEGDFAGGMRRDPSEQAIRGDFATGVRGTTEPLPRHHGDFAAGIRARLQTAVVPGDFALGLRAADGEARP